MKVKKVIALTLAVIILVCTTVFVTIAYLKDSDSAVNTMTVGQIEISLDEAKVNEYGKEVSGASRVQKNEYKLIPGHTYIKDPTVYVEAKSEESYVRMLVTVVDIENVKSAFDVPTGDHFLPQNYVAGWNPAVWAPVTNIVYKTVTASDGLNYPAAVYEFRYVGAENAGVKSGTVKKTDIKIELAPLFETFTVPYTLTQAKINLLDKMEIQVVAHAIQADGFANADTAWTAFGD